MSNQAACGFAAQKESKNGFNAGKQVVAALRYGLQDVRCGGVPEERSDFLRHPLSGICARTSGGSSRGLKLLDRGAHLRQHPAVGNHLLALTQGVL